MSEDGRAEYTLIRDLPQGERPRERLRDYGAGALSNSELVAILLRTGGAGESALSQASRLVATYGGLPGLARATFAELCAERGLGEAKAAQLKAALEIAVRMASTTRDERGVVRTPDDIAALVSAEMSLLEQEHVRIVLLDTRNHVLGISEVYRGSVHTAQVRIAELLREAVRANATAVVAVHNHPSGDPSPSAADATMTRELYEAGKLMDIDVVDHIIIGGGSFASLRRLGVGFPKDTAPATLVAQRREKPA